MECVICSIEGRVVQQLMNVETKSEGVRSLLVDREQRSYNLFREGEPEFGDSYFDDFADQEVRVEGELINGVWLKVITIDKIITE